MTFDFNLDTTIKQLYEWGRISVRTYNSLHAAGLETLGEVLDSIETPMDLLGLRNFGRKAYTEIESILNGLLRSHAALSTQTKEDRFAALGEKIVGIIADAYTTVTQGGTAVKAYLQAAYSQPSDMHELVMGDVEQMLTVVEEYTREENLEIRHSFKQFIEMVVGKMEYAQEAENDIYAEYKRKSMDLAVKMEDFTYEQVARYFLSPIASDYLEKIYQEKKEAMLSVRSKNFVNRFVPHFSDLIKYADEPLTNYRNICPGQNMMKTLRELFQFNQKFRQDFDRISRLNDDEIQTEFLKRDYPFLTSCQRLFVFEFTKANGHAPLFFLLLQFLRLSENRSNKIYCLFNGIFDGQKRTLNEIADAMSLSKERIRQIIDKKRVRGRTEKGRVEAQEMLNAIADAMSLSKERIRQIIDKKSVRGRTEKGRVSSGVEAQEIPLLNHADWDCYDDLFNLPFIYERTDEYVNMKETEHLYVDFGVFASLVELVADFRTEEIEGRTILVNNKYKDLNLTYCLDVLGSMINAKYTADTYVAVDSILSNVPESFRPQMKEIIKYVVAEIYKVEITEGDNLYLHQNFIDVSEELYEILAQKGEPMHVDDIFSAFKAKYPDYKYTEPIQIKSALYKHKHIRAVGKTSCYALDSWEGVYFGSIRDLLVDLLNDSDVPLHIDVLYDGVSEYYPNTTKSSVAATMEDGDLHRFVEFEGDYFGLTSKEYSAEYVVATSVQRYRFDERFRMLKDFVSAYHRFPSYNGSEQEASLMRWLYNVTSGILTMTNEQKAQLDEALRAYDEQGIPRSATEAEFLLKCQDVKDYIRQNYTLPSNSKAPELYAWLRRSRDNYDSYTDKRRGYMTDLLNYILSLGFSI